MNNDLKNILTNLNKDVEQEKLLQYLNREMSDAEQHEFEKTISDDAFAEDAIEGLEQLNDKNNIPYTVDQINLQLKKEISKRNKKRSRRSTDIQPWIYYAILIVLLIAVITFLVIRRM